ncbi:MAG: response regulator transcription factor [Candidatus Omnitrophota bacterium]
MPSSITKKKILIVDDEKELVRLISFHMGIAGYAVVAAYDGIEALEVCKRHKPDLVVLDVLLPRIDGWEVCRRLRNDPKTRNIPIIMLSALSEVNNKLKGFGLGADDYVTKPFSPRELVARVKRVLLRSQSGPAAVKSIAAGQARINMEDFSVWRAGRQVALTEKETSILKLLVSEPGRVFSHSQILDAVWGEDNIVEYANIDVHISHLREKIEKDPQNPRAIKTVKGEGYKFEG